MFVTSKNLTVKNPVKHIDCTTCQNLALSSFCSLKQSELEQLNEHKLTHRVKKNQVIFREGDTAKGMHCVHQGKVKLYKTTADGSMQILRIAGAGELVGYRGLLGDGKYIATGVALEESVVCFIPKERIFNLINTNVKFTMEIISKFAQDLSLAESKSVNFIQKSSRARLAETLLLLEKSFGTTADHYLNIILTREDIASISGMVTETVVRVLREWEDDHIIALNKKQISIINHTKLVALAELEE